MKLRKRAQRTSLGELIVALFEETKKVSNDPVEQRYIVYTALHDLLRRKRGLTGHQFAFMNS